MVREEILFLQDYFSLQKIRYGNAVALIIELPAEITEHCIIPPISLQLLAENALKHNEYSLQHPLVISIHFKDERIFIRNRLSKRPLNKFSPKSGLQNLQERYKLTAGLDIHISEDTKDFTVSLPILKTD